jgi:ABC-2 type transport system permease protein
LFSEQGAVHHLREIEPTLRMFRGLVAGQEENPGIRRGPGPAKRVHQMSGIFDLMAALFNPLLMIFLFGYALSLDVDRIPTYVFDQDQTPASREIISLLSGSKYFNVVGYIEREPEIDVALISRDALLVFVVPTGFSARAKRGLKAPIQAIFDGSDSNTAAIAVGYLKAVTAGFDIALQSKRLRQAGLRMVDMPVKQGSGVVQSGDEK